MNTRKLELSHSRLLVMLAIMAMSVLASACAAGNEPGTGDSDPTETSGAAGKVGAPAFAVETFTHGTFDLAALEGKPVVLNFWFPSCAPCTAEMPDIQDAYETYGDQVAFIGAQQTSLNTAEEGREFLEELGITYPNFGDQGGKVQYAYGVLNYPTTVFLDSDHNINRTWMGLISKEHLEDQIQAIIES